MTEKRFRSSPTDDYNFADVLDNEKWIGSRHVDCADDFCKKMNELNDENEQLKQQLSDINGQLVMLDNCDNWDYDRMKHTVREIAEIIGYNGTINPKR